MMWQSPLPVQVRPNASEVAPPGGRTPFLPGLWWSAQPVPQPNATVLTPFPTVMERGTALESFGRAPTPRSGFFPGVWDSRPDFREGFCVRATCAGASPPSPPVLSPVPPRPVGALPAAPDVGYDPDAVRAGAAAADAAANVKIRAALALVSMDDSMQELLSKCGSPLTGGAALRVAP